MYTCSRYISFMKPIQRFPNTSIKSSTLYADQIGYGQDFPWSCHWASSHAEHEDKWRFNQRSWHDRNQVWLTAHPVCAEVNNAMQQFTGVRCTVQHKWAAQRLDHGKAREIYGRLVWTIRVFLTSKPIQWQLQFAQHCDRNQCWHINVDTAKDVGEKILTSMAQQKVLKHSFKKKYQAVTLSTSTVRVNNETIQIDPQLLFQRLITAGTRNGQ